MTLILGVANCLAAIVMVALSHTASAQIVKEGSVVIVLDPNGEDKGMSIGPVVIQDPADQPEAFMGLRVPGGKCGQVRTAGESEWRNCKWNWRGECVCK